jgi:hypothetical protein
MQAGPIEVMADEKNSAEPGNGSALSVVSDGLDPQWRHTAGARLFSQNP